jgi:hypothetical protein
VTLRLARAHTVDAPPEAPPTRPIPVAAFVTGAASVVSLTAFAVLALKGQSELRDLRATCKPDCSPSDVNAARTKLLVGDISLGVGLVALGATTWLVLTRAPSNRQSHTTLEIGPSPHAVWARFERRF